MALIDPTVIKKLVLTALGDAEPALAGVLLAAHEEDEREEQSGGLWFRLVQIDSSPLPRRSTPRGQSGREADIEIVTLVINCHATDQRIRDEGDNLLDLAAGELKRVLVDRLEIDTATNHQLHFRSAQVRDLSNIARSRAIRGRQLIVDAHASRGSGTAQLPHTPAPDVEVIGD